MAEATQSGLDEGLLHPLGLSGWLSSVVQEDLGAALVAAGILLVFLTLRHLLSRWAIVLLKRWASRSASDVDDTLIDALRRPLTFAPIAVGVLLAVEHLVAAGLLSGMLAEIGRNLGASMIAIAFFWALTRLVEPLSMAMRRLERMLSPEIVSWIVRATRIALWLIGIATVLDLWGVRVLPILAGFGLIGVAVALGAQDLFKNLISGVLVLAERRFRVGDWVKVDGVVEGTVEEIGFRSTKVRQFDKAPVYIPNAAFADGALVNYGEMPHRRIYWVVGLEYRTTAVQLTRIRQEIEQWISQDPRFLPPPEASRFVRIDRFAASSIDLLIYCFTKTRDWGEWLLVKEELLLKIKSIVEKEGAGFAFPSQSVYVETTPGGADRPNAVERGDATEAPAAASAKSRAAAQSATTSAKSAADAAKPAASVSGRPARGSSKNATSSNISPPAASSNASGGAKASTDGRRKRRSTAKKRDGAQ